MKINIYRDQHGARKLLGAPPPLYDVTCIPLTGYSTKMPFAIGRHRYLDEIDERDIMSIALDLDVGLDDFDVAIRAVMKGLSCPDVSGHDEGTMRMVGQILDNSAKRMRVLGDFIGL